MKQGKTYSNTPDAALLEDIGQGTYNVQEAVAELVANSFDARVGVSQMRIDVTLTDKSISILDNGRGMSEEELADAMILGVKMDLIRPRGHARKGLYGLGLKTACASLGRAYSITTKDGETGITARVNIDLQERRKHVGDRDFVWEITPVLLEDGESGILGSMPSGTLIEVTKLHDSSSNVGPVSQKLGHSYKPHLQDGDSITVNGSAVPVQEFKLEPNSRIEIDKKIDVDGIPINIKGWAGLDSKTHNDGNYGMNLFRNDQLIETWYKGWFRAHLMTSRIVGELHLDGLTTNHHKKGFDEQSPEWKAIYFVMKEWMKPIAAASSNMNKNKNDPLKKEKAVEGMRKAMGMAATLPNAAHTETTSGRSDTDLAAGESNGNSGLEVQEEAIKYAGDYIRLAHSIQPMGADDYLPWDYIFDEEELELQTIINEDSPLYLAISDEGFFATLAMADTMMTFLVSDKGVAYARAREMRDRWLELSVTGKRQAESVDEIR